MYLKQHKIIKDLFWAVAGRMMRLLSFLVPVKRNSIMFASLGGRSFDDSPKYIYDEICKREEFNDWEIVWAFVNPKEQTIPIGKKVSIDTLSFVFHLLSSHVWVSNSSMDRGIEFKKKGIIRVETEHGCPIKRIGEERTFKNKRTDKDTIRCAQSVFDRDVFCSVRNADASCFSICGLPRNDTITKYSDRQCNDIKLRLRIPLEKKVMFYTPTFREFNLNSDNQTYLAPPINLKNWEDEFGEEYVLLIRAHYAVIASLGIQDTEFVKDVSKYAPLNDLYAISDIMISDYSGTFIDYSILDRPMFCFAYDYDEYKKKRGFFIDINTELPCSVDHTEDEVIYHIKNMDRDKCCEMTHKFHMKYAPYDGNNASEIIVDRILYRLNHM